MSAVNKNFSISISYPPLISPKGKPFLSQNRQFQWTNTGNVIYPVIPAYAATLLKSNHYRVFWDDAIAQKLSYRIWLKRLVNRHPNLVVIETKTPVVNYHWQIIADVKKSMPQSTVVLMGDHVTALPLESFQHCPVDYVITGGDYDFMLLNLADHLTKKTPLEPGFYYRHRQSIKNSGKFALKHHQLDLLPIIDRQLTKWKLYSDNNTNFKYRPGAYIMSGRDCWWGKCTFCSWTTIFPSGSYRHFSVDHTVNEITNLVENFGAREIFDDSGTIPVGTWLNQLCHRLIETGLNRKVVLGCNLRFSSLTPGQYKLLKQAGFRFILYGLESANQSTLNRIHKNIKITDFKKTLNYAKSAGLEPHITIMIGYPWESLSDIKNTLNLAKNLFHHGLVDSLQATLVIPYPGTPLYKYCRRHRLLLTQNWTDFDMRQPVIRSSLSSETLNRLIISFYQSVITPRFILHKFLSIRNINDIKHLAYYAYKFLKKLRDFPRQTKN